MIFLHERRDAFGSLPGQPLLDLGHQGTGDPLPPPIGMHRHSINVTSPAIEYADDRADHSPVDLGHKDMSRAFRDGSPQIHSSVGHAGSGVRLPPQFENRLHVLDATISNDIIAHHGPQQSKKTRSSHRLPRASSLPEDWTPQRGDR